MHASASDADGLPSPLSYSLVSGPHNGQLVFHADGSFTYTPTADFNSSDSFTFRANDGESDLYRSEEALRFLFERTDQSCGGMRFPNQL